MEVLIALPFVAYVGEKLAERLLKPIIIAISALFPSGVPQGVRDWFEAVVCAIPGFAISLLAGLDLFEAVGVPLAGQGGLIVTALAVGFGSNFIHDLLGYLDEARNGYLLDEPESGQVPTYYRDV